jgi:hypothetical protein
MALELPRPIHEPERLLRVNEMTQERKPWPIKQHSRAPSPFYRSSIAAAPLRHNRIDKGHETAEKPQKDHDACLETCSGSGLAASDE